MDFSYLGFVNRLLMQTKGTTIENFSGVVLGDDAYKCQLAVNDTISDMSLLLRIKKRLTNFTIATVAAQRTYRVPVRVIYPFVSLRQKSSDTKIVQMPTEEFDQFVPDDASSGDPRQYYLDAYSCVDVQPDSAGEVIYAVSDDVSDSSQVVIQGYDTNGNFVSEEITLTGETPVASVNTYRRIENISKIETAGTITFRNSGATTTYVTMSGKEKVKRVMVMGLNPIPSKVITIYGRGYLRVPSLTNEYDTPIGFSEDHINAINFGALWRYRKYGTDAGVESVRESKQDYVDEILKITSLDVNDPDLMHRMASPYEAVSGRPPFGPLDRRLP